MLKKKKIGVCYKLNVDVPPRILTLKPKALCDSVRRWAFGRCLGYEGGVLINGISALIRQATEIALFLLPCLITAMRR